MNHEFLEHKVGIKILDDNKLENIFPMYHSLKNKIDECRKAAGMQLGQSLKKHYQYNYMYDNVFSILGERGTGKTSVAFTLKENIEKESKKRNYHDIVLPIIIPEAIPDNCTILGWLLAVVKEEIEHLKCQLKDKKVEEKDSYWDTCRYPAENKIDNLSKKLNRLSKMFFAGNYNPANEHSYYEAVGNSAVQVEDYYQFAQEIAELWDTWVNALCELTENDKNNSQKKCPLIYFIFDDVDLAPEKIGELLSVIIKYLSHPNLIVITTADEKLFLEVIENRLDRSIGRLPREWRTYLTEKKAENLLYLDDNSIDEAKEKDFVGMTALRYLGKVMPPSTRYYLRLFNTASQKEHFQLETENNLGECVRLQVEKLLACTIQEKGRPGCFMGRSNKICNFYLNFFGNTSRQIGNIYIGIKDLVDNLVSEIDLTQKELHGKPYYLSRIFEICKYFINIVIHTNHHLSSITDDVDEFINNIFLQEYMGWKLYVNYAYLDEFLETFSEDDIQLNLSVGLQLYSLLAFIENILLILESCTKHGITGRQEIHAVEWIAGYLNNHVLDGRYVFRTNFNADKFFQHYGTFLDSLHKIIADKDSDKKFDMEYFYIFKNEPCEDHKLGLPELLQMYRDNPNWLKEMAGMISMVYGGAYLINQKLLDSVTLSEDSSSKLGYQAYIKRTLEENVKDYMNEFDLYNCSKQLIEFTDSIEFQYNEDEYRSLITRLRNELTEKIKEQHQFESNNAPAHLYLPLATIIKHVEDAHSAIKDVLAHCPQEISNAMTDILQCGLNETVVQELLQKEISYIREIEWIAHHVTFYNPENWLVVMAEIGKNENPIVRKRAKELHQLVSPIFQKSQMEQSPEQIISSLGTSDLSKIQTLLEELSTGLKYDNDLDEIVPELSSDLDIVVDLNNPDEFEKALKMGIHLLFTEWIQLLYVSLKVKNSYESGSYLSAKNLQWITTDSGQQKNAYYYQLFEVMQRAVKLGGNTKNMRSEILQRNINELQHLINSTTRSHRRSYIDSILR